MGADQDRAYWTRGDIAEHLKVDPATARRWAERDDFPKPAFRTASKILAWDADEVREWRRGVVRARRESQAF